MWGITSGGRPGQGLRAGGGVGGGGLHSGAQLLRRALPRSRLRRAHGRALRRGRRAGVRARAAAAAQQRPAGEGAELRRAHGRPGRQLRAVVVLHLRAREGVHALSRRMAHGRHGCEPAPDRTGLASPQTSCAGMQAHARAAQGCAGAGPAP